MKTNLIALVFYDSLIGKTNCRSTACFSELFYLLFIFSMVSRCTCNTKVIVDVSSNSLLVHEQLLQWGIGIYLTSYNAVNIQLKYLFWEVVESYRVTAWYLHAVRLKIRGSYFSLKLANECLNIRERRKVVDRNKNDPSLHLVPRELLVCVKENPDKKTNIN